MNARTRLAPEQRKEDILRVAIRLAESNGYDKITRKEIADAAKITEGLVSFYWGTMKQLRRSLMRHAIANKNFRIIAQGLCVNDSATRNLPPDLRSQVVNHLAG